ncbi:MAG: hypothetical protein PHS86_07205 [Syntrophaceae bacterium]|nr:hypothetical protein [Syntrophaceae bacterium]
MPFLSGAEAARNGPFKTSRQITSHIQAEIIAGVAQSRRIAGNSLQVVRITADSLSGLTYQRPE